MKTRTFQPLAARLRALWFVSGSLIAAIIIASVALWSSSATAHSSEPAPLIAILTPQERASLNATTLRVQALVAAVRSRTGESFVFNGQTVAGRNAGRVRRVDLALDGILVQSIDSSEYGRQFVVDSRFDLSNLSAGQHLLTISALQGNGNNETTKSFSTTFTLDRTLVLAETNRIEDAATPKPFAGLRVRGWDGQDDDDADEEDPWQCPSRFDLKGTIILGSLSDGLDLARDRVVVALGAQTKVFEAGTLNCNGQEKVCRLEDASAPFVRFIELKRKNNGRWKYRLRGVGSLPGSGGPTLSLRIGNDWGGLDLTTGERLAGLRPNLDASHQMQALIGPAGGTVETVDGRGVHVSLEIPAGALTRDTLIKMTPLTSSPLAGGSTALHPGIKFEPEGLQFAEAATLTLDFSATGQPVNERSSIFLLTSPLTQLPIYGTTDSSSKILKANIHHFTNYQPNPGNPPFSDQVQWAQSVLTSQQNLSVEEIENLLAILNRQHVEGCTGSNCINVGQASQRIDASARAIVASECPGDAINPSLAALEKYLRLETWVQQLGGTVSELRPCQHNILEALITQAGSQPGPLPANLFQYDAATDPTLVLLNRLATLAQLLGFNDLQTSALQKLDQAMRQLAQMLQQFVRARAGQPDADATRDAGVSVLRSEVALANGAYSRVLSVDPGLPLYIQQIINGLSNSDMIVTLDPADGVSPYYPYHSTAAFLISGDSIMYQSLSGTRTMSWYDFLSFGRPYGPARRPPILFATQVGQTLSQFELTEPRPNVLAWDVTTSAPIDGYASAEVAATLQFSKAGTLRIDVNPSWGTGKQQLVVDFYGDDALTSVAEASNWAVFLPIRCFAAPDPNAPLPGCYTNSTETTSLLTIPRPLKLSMSLSVRTQFQQRGEGPASGAGRLVTMTFTPQ